MKVLLDSSFILSCMRERIDFLSQLEEQGFSVIVPREVMQELKDLKLKVSHDDRILVDVALQMIEKSKVKKMKLGARIVDQGLIEKGKEGYYIATLDKVIKSKIDKKIVIFSSQNRVGVE